MALIDCPECRHKISERASACPQCGYPLKEEKLPPRREFPFLDPLAQLAAVAEDLAAAVHRTLRPEEEKTKQGAAPDRPETKARDDES